MSTSDFRNPPSQDELEESGDEKDDEIARLKRAYHDAVMENSNKKTSAKTNTYVPTL
jgi:DnaJ-domain-containing protein 1